MITINVEVPTYQEEFIQENIPSGMEDFFMTFTLIRVLQTIPVESVIFQRAEEHLRHMGFDTEGITQLPLNGGIFPSEPLSSYFDKYEYLGDKYE